MLIGTSYVVWKLKWKIMLAPFLKQMTQLIDPTEVKNSLIKKCVFSQYGPWLQSWQTQEDKPEVKQSEARFTTGLPDGVFCGLKKQQFWVNFGESRNRRYWYILWPFYLFYGHLIYIFYGHLIYFMAIWSTYFMAIWSILWPFDLFYGHLIYFTAIW
jgi:hypothetical protein